MFGNIYDVRMAISTISDVYNRHVVETGHKSICVKQGHDNICFNVVNVAPSTTRRARLIWANV